MDLEEEAIKELAELEKKIFVKDGIINICILAAPYQILLSRCDTQEKILAWVLHLTEKPWMTAVVINEFIELAIQHNSVTMNRNV